MVSTNINDLFDFEKSFTKTIEFQEKLINNMNKMLEYEDDYSNITPRELIYTDNKLKLYRYKSQANYVSKIPTLIVSSLVKTSSIMDINQDKSFIKKLLEEGIDVHLIEWGFPTADDKYLTLEDYIDWYMDDCVDYILESTDSKKLNILGVGQGGTLATIYTALYSNKVKNLITMVTPFDFSSDDSLLFKRAKHLEVDKIVDAYGVVPSELINTVLYLNINKYMDLINDLDSMSDFKTIERWMLNGPDQAGKSFKQFINDLFRDNKLIKGTMKIGRKTIDLKNIDNPILNIYADNDSQVPNAASKSIEKYVSSKDVTTMNFPTDHIGIFISKRSQKEIAPTIASWAKRRSR